MDLVLRSSLTTVMATYHLTQSFRFGAEIAFLANCCLSGLLGVDGPVLVGSRDIDSVTGCPSVKHDVGKVAVLARTNLRLISEMVELVCLAGPEDTPKIAFPNGSENMGWQMLLNLSHFQSGNIHLIPKESRKNKIYRMGWKNYKQFVEDSNDVEMLTRIGIVERFGAKLPEYIQKIREHSNYAIHDPQVQMVFITVHKFKGLEMGTVRLLDDFAFSGIPYEKPGQNTVRQGEFNLLYVALTRAKKRL